MLCSCFKCESGLKKTKMHVVRQTAFYCCTFKNPAKLWLMHKSIRKRIKTNNKHTVAVLCLRHVPFLWFFCFVIIRNFNSFCSSFITVTGLKILTTMLIPGTMLIKNGSSFPPPRLFRAPRLFGREEYVTSMQTIKQWK